MKSYFIFINNKKLIFIWLAVILLSSCKISRHIPEGEYLLQNAKVTGAPSQFNEDLQKLVRPRPNAHLFTLNILPKTRMWIYIWADRGRERRVKTWLMENIGEPPVLLDSFAVNASSRQMNQFMFNKGYFNADVDFDIQLRNNQRAKVEFEVTPRNYYTINNIEYFIQDRIIDSLVMTDTVSSLLRRGRRYDSRVLADERERVTNFIRNSGFYNFTREFVYFEVDTTAGNNQVNVGLGITSRPDFQRHKIYYIDTIFVQPNYQMFRAEVAPNDTFPVNGYVFITDEMVVRHQVLKDLVFINSDQLYQEQDVRYTIRRINDLRLFRFIDVQFREKPIEGVTDTAMLDAFIRLTPYRQYESIFDVEFKVSETETRSDMMFGITGSVGFRNKNLFKSAIQHEFRIRGGIEDLFESDPFNYRLGASTALHYPKLIFPWQPPGTIVANTSVDLTYFYERTFQYERSTGRFQYYYQIHSDNFRVFWIPSETSLINTLPIISIPDDRFSRSIFEPHLINANRLTLIYSNRIEPVRNSFWYLKSTVFETGGNFFWLTRDLIGQPNQPGKINKYSVFDSIDFYQFVRTEWDLRYNYIIDSRRSLVTRVFSGIGVPYGNSELMPYVKRFIAGGSNSMRGWRLGELGPGAYIDTSRFHQRLSRLPNTGEFMFEANAEYRFDMGRMWKGAFFIDAGNIWSKSETDPPRPGGELNNLGEFFNEMAIASGAGIRWDFTYFVIRADYGLPVRFPANRLFEVPAYPNGETRGIQLRDGRINIGIGYPF